MDMITLSLASQKALRELGVSVEPAKVLKFNGNADNIYNGFMVKVSNEVWNLNSVESITAISGGATVEYDKTALVIQDGIGLGLPDEAPAMMIVPDSVVSDAIGIPIGTYFYYQDAKNHTTVAKTAETIHPIDPKYLPGVCLPVVVLSEETSSKVDLDGLAALTAEEGAAFDAALEMASPVVLNMTFDGVARYAVVLNNPIDGVFSAFMLYSAESLYTVFVTYEDGWYIQMKPLGAYGLK